MIKNIVFKKKLGKVTRERDYCSLQQSKKQHVDGAESDFQVITLLYSNMLFSNTNKKWEAYKETDKCDLFKGTKYIDRTCPWESPRTLKQLS